MTDSFSNLTVFKMTSLLSTVQRFTFIYQKMTELQLFELGPNLTMLAKGETTILFIQ